MVPMISGSKAALVLHDRARAERFSSGMESTGWSLAGQNGSLRILHVLPRLGVGGTERNALKLAQHADNGFEHGYCAVRGVDRDICNLSRRLGRVFIVDRSRSGFQLQVLRLARIMREYRPHIVHSRNCGAIESVLAARFANGPVIVHRADSYALQMI